jgi:hypothetical protein
VKDAQSKHIKYQKKSMNSSYEFSDKRTGVLLRIPRTLSHSGAQLPDPSNPPALGRDILVQLPEPVLEFQFEQAHTFDDFGWNLNWRQEGTSGRDCSEFLVGETVYGDLGEHV